MTRQQAERQEAIANLREMLQPGDTVYTVLRRVSRSGMSRVIDCYKLEDGEPRWLSYRVALACGMTFNDRPGQPEGIRIGGCGMDMGFHIVTRLSRTLFPQWDCIGEKGNGGRCPANDHFNGDRNYQPHPHSDGGYALRHRWL